jgi:hypothetical protein
VHHSKILQDVKTQKIRQHINLVSGASVEHSFESICVIRHVAITAAENLKVWETGSYQILQNSV